MSCIDIAHGAPHTGCSCPTCVPDKWAVRLCARDHRTPGTIEVPESEVEALAETKNASRDLLEVAIEPIIARLPPREPDHVETLRERSNELVGLLNGHLEHRDMEKWRRELYATQAAIRNMGGKL